MNTDAGAAKRTGGGLPRPVVALRSVPLPSVHALVTPATVPDIAVATPFEELFRSTYPRLVRALAVASDHDAAADAVQDAFVQANVHWRRVGQLDNPGAWVRRAAINRLANQRRGRRRRDAFVARQDPRERTTGLDPVDLDLAAALRKLPDQQRLAVCLHYLADLSVADIADTLEVVEGTVKSNLHDARLALRGHLGARTDD